MDSNPCPFGSVPKTVSLDQLSHLESSHYLRKRTRKRKKKREICDRYFERASQKVRCHDTSHMQSGLLAFVVGDKITPLFNHEVTFQSFCDHKKKRIFFFLFRGSDWQI